MPKDVGESGVRTRSAESLRAQYIIRFSAFLCTKSRIYSMLGVHLLYSPTSHVTAWGNGSSLHAGLCICAPVDPSRRAVSLTGCAPGWYSRADCTAIRLRDGAARTCLAATQGCPYPGLEAPLS